MPAREIKSHPLVAEHPDGSLSILSAEIPHHLQAICNHGSYENALRNAYQTVRSANLAIVTEEEEANDLWGSDNRRSFSSFYPYFAAAIVKRALNSSSGLRNFNVLLQRMAVNPALNQSKFIFLQAGFAPGPTIRELLNPFLFFQLIYSDFIENGPIIIDFRPLYSSSNATYSSSLRSNTYSIDGGFGIIYKIDVFGEKLSIFFPMAQSIDGYRTDKTSAYTASQLLNVASRSTSRDKPFWYSYTGY